MDPSAEDTTDSEEEQPEPVSGPPGFGSGSLSGAGAGGSALEARLGLHFNGAAALGPGPGCGGRALSWRDGRFSDWAVQVGEKTYCLHAFLLARASLFFESHMSVAAQVAQNATATTAAADAPGVLVGGCRAPNGVDCLPPGTATRRGSDLTEVLPQSCHAAFEDALDFIYSENQAAFEVHASKALLLLKIADILGIGGLFDAMGWRIEVAFSETAPLLLEQYCRFHIPGTDDGAPLRKIREGALDLVVRRFQPFLASPEMRTALLRLPAAVIAEILEQGELLVDGEDTVFDFVAARLEESPAVGGGRSSRTSLTAAGGAGCGCSGGLGPGAGVRLDSVGLAEFCEDEEESPAVGGGRSSLAALAATGGAGCGCSGELGAGAGVGPDSVGLAELCEDEKELLWHRVRWAHLSAGKFTQALALGQRLLRPQCATDALVARLYRLDLGGVELVSLGPQVGLSPPRHPVLPPGVPPPTSTEIDLCFHYVSSDHYSCGEALRSQPKRIGDVVLRVLVFPAGTDTGVARGSLSVFLEAVPQPHWPREWEFANIRYAIACIRWPSGTGEWSAKRKSDLWTFKANRLDRGWHDFLAPGEIHRYLGPDGFVCIRGSLERECLNHAFLFSNQSTHGGYPGPGGDAAGSSACRRSWAPRASGGPAPPPSAPVM